MKLSLPIYRLKRRAKLLAREDKIPLHQALDRIAAAEGFSSWSLLSAKLAPSAQAGQVLGQLDPGDLVLVGARPGHGKTLMCLQLAVEAMREGKPVWFFTLEYTKKEVFDQLHDIGVVEEPLEGRFNVDFSDGISSDHIIGRLSAAPPGAFVVVDYLQLLDQRRDQPDLDFQVRALRAFAKERKLTMVFLSQISRSFEQSGRSLPGVDDVRLPNPLDLTLFDKKCFLSNGEALFSAA